MARALVIASTLFLLAGGGGSNSSNAAASRSSNARPSSTSSVPWPAPDRPMQRARLAGLTPERAEQLAYHVHSHLDVFVDGKRKVVPAGIGIAISNPAVHMYRATDGSVGYGGINPPCAKPCISPLHTHFDDGVLHTESATRRGNRLGQFFTEWGVRLDRKCVDGYCRPGTRVAIYVDGRRYRGDPRSIQLKNRREIAVVIGSPPPTIPHTVPF